VKKIILFVTSWCPHCQKARELIRELVATHPEYRAVQLQVIDEEQETAVAAKYDYYFVPTFYVDDEKVHEGKVDKEIVCSIFKSACA